MSRFIQRSVVVGVASLMLVLGAPTSMAQRGGGGKGPGKGPTSSTEQGQQGDQAQPGGAGPGGPGGGSRGPGGRGQFDPERMRQMFSQRIKERLGATDEEWKALEPLVTKVTEAQRAARPSMGSMFGSDRRGPSGSSENANPAQEALQKATEDESTPAADIQAKLKAFREDRQKKEAELKTAREELRKVVTARQEAILVLMGILD